MMTWEDNENRRKTDKGDLWVRAELTERENRKTQKDGDAP